MKKAITFEKELEFPSMIGEITSISLDHNLEFTSNNEVEGNLLIEGTYKMTEASTLEEKFSYSIPADITLTENLEEDTRKVSISDFSYSILNDVILKCNIEVLIEGVEEITIEEEEEKEEIESLDLNDKSTDNKEEMRECDGDIKLEKEIEEKLDMEQEISQKENKEETHEDDVYKVSSKTNEVVLEEKKRIISNIETEDVVEKRNEDDNVKEKEEQKEQNKTNVNSLFQAFENSEETFTTYSVYIVRKEDSLEKIMDDYKVNKEQLSEYNDLSTIEVGSKIIIPTCNE